MATGRREPLEGFGEAAFEEHGPDVGAIREMRPEQFRRACVGGERHARRPVVHDHRERFGAVRHGHRCDPQPRPLDGHERLDRRGGEEPVTGRREREEIGPHPVVEQVAPHGLEHAGRREHLHAVGAGHVGVLEEQGQAREMVEMRVREEHVTHAPLELEVRLQADRPAVDHDRIVDEIAGQELWTRFRPTA